MEFTSRLADLFIPDGVNEGEALTRTTHLGIGAHPDDLEFMAFAGIVHCLEREEDWFGGITCTTGSGSPRGGPYKGFSAGEMTSLRREEQRRAAALGCYSFMAQLGYESRELAAEAGASFRSELAQLLEKTRPEIVYTHNPMDKHSTHIVVLLAVVDALRGLPPEIRPKRLLGCEGWRGLDWLVEEDRLELDVSGADELAEQLNRIFDSQITGNKRYDLAVMGRRRSNATFSSPRSIDTATQVCLAVEMTALLQDDSLSVSQLASRLINRFQGDVLKRLKTRD